jgi:hypothetical protein
VPDRLQVAFIAWFRARPPRITDRQRGADRKGTRSLIACSDIAPHFRAGNFQPLLIGLSVMSEITTLVSSIDPLAPYKASDDLVLELVSVTAIIRVDPEDASAAPCKVKIVEPHTLIVHQPPGGYLLDNRQVQMTCAKSAGVCLGDEIKFRVAL